MLRTEGTYEMPSPTATALVGLSHRGSRVGFHAAAANRKIRRCEASQCGQPYVIVAFLLLFFASGCSKWLQDEELTLIRQSYNGNELRTDGYYYYREDGKIWFTYFFYQNGTLLYGVGTDTLDNNLEKYDAWFVSETFLNYIKTNKRRWGLFEIHNDSIVFERWSIQEGGDLALRFSGKILNDTTFIITRSEYPHQGNAYNKNEVFHFRQFSPKPDSTNVFIP